MQLENAHAIYQLFSSYKAQKKLNVIVLHGFGYVEDRMQIHRGTDFNAKGCEQLYHF